MYKWAGRSAISDALGNHFDQPRHHQGFDLPLDHSFNSLIFLERNQLHSIEKPDIMRTSTFLAAAFATLALARPIPTDAQGELAVVRAVRTAMGRPTTSSARSLVPKVALKIERTIPDTNILAAPLISLRHVVCSA
ncbi:hypothetical protein TruAng_012199 [Truncatella angustata]|nr:hypothetical protein TruAng_012199 [Truncatella angustata]